MNKKNLLAMPLKIKWCIDRSSLFFEQYWLPILLFSGALAVKQEAAIALILYAYFSLKIIQHFLNRETPQSSIEQNVLLIGAITLSLSHYLFQDQNFFHYELFNWFVFITAPFYFTKELRFKSPLQNYTLYALFAYLTVCYFSNTPKSQWQHVWLSNPNIVALLVLYLAFLTENKTPLHKILNCAIVSSILFMLGNKGGLILYLIIETFLALRLRLQKRTIIAAGCIFLGLLLVLQYIDLNTIRNAQSVNKRIDFYTFFLNYFSENTNKLFGHGFGSVERIADNSKEAFNYPYTNIRKIRHVHNEILESLIEGGLFWIITLLISFYYFFYRNLRAGYPTALKFVFLIVFLATIQIYSSYRNGIIYSLIPFLCLAYGYRNYSMIKNQWLNKIVFYFYIISIPILTLQAFNKFIAYENLRAPSLEKINHSIQLLKTDPYFYNEKLKLLGAKSFGGHIEPRITRESKQANDLDADFYHTKNKLDAIHPNYRFTELITSHYEFSKGNFNKAYHSIKEQSEGSYDLIYNYHLVYYAAFISEKLLEIELIQLLEIATEKIRQQRKLVLETAIVNQKFEITNQNKQASIDLKTVKDAILLNKEYGYKQFHSWLHYKIIKKSFGKEALDTGNPILL